MFKLKDKTSTAAAAREKFVSALLGNGLLFSCSHEQFPSRNRFESYVETCEIFEISHKITIGTVPIMRLAAVCVYDESFPYSSRRLNSRRNSQERALIIFSIIQYSRVSFLIYRNFYLSLLFIPHRSL